MFTAMAQDKGAHPHHPMDTEFGRESHKTRQYAHR